MSVEPMPATLFAFDVPAGYYVYSGFNGAPLNESSLDPPMGKAFEALANRVV